jgi:hypothetical protein
MGDRSAALTTMFVVTRSGTKPCSSTSKWSVHSTLVECCRGMFPSAVCFPVLNNVRAVRYARARTSTSKPVRVSAGVHARRAAQQRKRPAAGCLRPNRACTTTSTSHFSNKDPPSWASTGGVESWRARPKLLQRKRGKSFAISAAPGNCLWRSSMEREVRVKRPLKNPVPERTRS